MQREKSEVQRKRSELFEEVVEAFAEKYSWLGAQASREMLISAASWNLQKHSNPPFRYRTHLMLAWERGWIKSTLMRTMSDILGDKFCSVIGKVSDAAMRGSVSGGSFTPPKPLRSPIVISTEFGQTDFSDELLNLFLAQLEEGKTNIALNKIGQLSENQKQSVQNNYDGKIQFHNNNEFDLKCDFVFWGATYDPSKLADDALRSRFNVVTPVKPLTSDITMAADESRSVMSMLSSDTVRSIRRELWKEEEFPTDFQPPERFYKEYGLTPRESRDIQAYMAARNWWGLDVNPKIMREYIEYMQESRRISTMEPKERVLDLIFDNPMTYSELQKETGYSKLQLYKIIDRIGAKRFEMSPGKATQWVVWSGDNDKEEDNDGGGLSNLE